MKPPRKRLSPREHILYQLEKQKLFPIQHHKLLEKLPRTINAGALIDEMLKLEEEGLIIRTIDNGSHIFGTPRYRATIIYTLSDHYVSLGIFQTPRFLESLA